MEPRAKRAPQAPKKVTEELCWGSCARCNQCGTCRRYLCNGKCTGCAKCTKCRSWGELVKQGNPDAVQVQENAAQQEPILKRQAKDPGNKAKIEFGKARPKSAAPGSTPCPYCLQWLPHYHQENCIKMPYDIWINALKNRSETKHGVAVVNSWTIQCQHCGSPFQSGASKRVHLSGCERRRNEAGLVLNSFPVIRDVLM